jgi:transposase
LSYNFLPYEQDQLFLMPPALSDWVKEGSLARFVSDLVDGLDADGELAAFYASYRSDGWGRAAYHPCMMLKVLLYSYCVGVRSSRRIAQALEQDVSLRYLAANQQPNFRTISDFRKDHLEALEGLFGSVLALCEAAGMVKLGVVALDGRKVAANAALDQNRTHKGLQRQISEILAEAERLDREEDERFGEDVRGDELPEGLRTREERLKRLKEARDRLAADAEQARKEQREKIDARAEKERRTGKKAGGRPLKAAEAVVDPEKRANTTDPESRIMQTRRGWIQGYNPQAMVDCETQVIVAQVVTQAEVDVGQLGPMLDQVHENVGRNPKACAADAGYWSEANAGLEGETELFIATTKGWKLKEQLAEQGPPRGRIPKDLTPQQRMERKLRTKRGQAIYGKRSTSVEPVFGQMEGRGLNRFWLRGVAKVGTEWSLFCTTNNILKLWRAQGPELKPAVT